MPQIFGQIPVCLLSPKGMGLIRKKGKTFGVPLLVRSAAAHTRRSGRPASNRRVAAALSESVAANKKL